MKTRKSDVMSAIKAKIASITVDGQPVFKIVKRGNISDESSFPVCFIKCPLAEKYEEPNSKGVLPRFVNLDVLIYIVTTFGDDKVDDTELDRLTDAVKDAMSELTKDYPSIAGLEWQHDEEFETLELSQQGIALYYRIQYEENTSFSIKKR